MKENEMPGQASSDLAIDIENLYACLGDTLQAIQRIPESTCHNGSNPHLQKIKLDCEKLLQTLDETKVSMKGNGEKCKTMNSIDSKSCLIVDDSSQYARVFSNILDRQNMDYDVAVNGLIALERIENNNYNFSLMDLQMPVMDGFETIQKIRSRTDDKKDLKVIAVTSCTGELLKEKCLKAGFTDFLNKPVSEDVLVSSISRLFDGEESQRVSMEKMPASLDVEVDLTYLQSISNGDKDFEKDMIESSIADIDARFADLEGALAQNEVAVASDSVHSLKSLLSIVGVTALYKQFDTLDGMFNRKSDFIPNLNFNSILSQWIAGKQKLEKMVGMDVIKFDS